MGKIYVFIPSYQREDMCVKAVLSCIEHIPQDLLGKIIVIDQTGYKNDIFTTSFVKHIVVDHPLKYVGKVYSVGVNAISTVLQDDDIMMFIDDDIELTSDMKRISELFDLLYDAKTGVIQLSMYKRTVLEKVKSKLLFKGGGMLIQYSKYKKIGKHGDDYLEDVELSLRATIKGFDNYRYNKIFNYHNFSHQGGLCSAFNVDRKGRLHLQQSQLDETYKGIVVRSEKAWLGFVLTRNWKNYVK